MSTKAQNKSLRIKEGRTELTVDHEGRDLTFVHPFYGTNIYANVGLAIERDGLIRPTMSEITSLVYSAFNSDDKYSKDIQKLMKNSWIRGFTGSRYIPEKGVYIEDDPQIRNGMPFMEESGLVRKLEANDKSVRFVPFGFKVGEMTSRQLAENNYIKGLVGNEGAEKLAEIADKHRNKPYLWSFEFINEPLTRVPGLGSFWGFDGRLDVSGYDHGIDRDGCSFGVSRTVEVIHNKK